MRATAVAVQRPFWGQWQSRRAFSRRWRPPTLPEVNIYSARKEALIRPLLDRFTEETGIEVNLVTDKADKLLARLKAEGENSPADLFITVDAGRLGQAKEAGVLQPVESDVLTRNIPEHLRDRDNLWFGLSKRARVIVYATDRVQESELDSYEGLADPKWKGRIAVRSSNNVYNQSLVASIIAANGEEKAEAWAAGLVANFARKPQGGDRDQVKAVASGEADVAIVNTYYVGRMLASKDARERAAAEKVAVFFPNQNDRGTHVNVSGAGLIVGAEHREEAIKLLEFLSTDEAQKMYAELNFEYPVKPGVPVAPLVAAWGEFKEDRVDLSRLGELNRDAVELMDRVGWR